MADHARSDHAGVQAALDALAALSPGRDTLGLERIAALCSALGHPERRLPPVFHVAGTNGKGSTVAMLRAMLEAAGLRVHAYTSPHLVRFNERIRLAGGLIRDDALAHYLQRVFAVSGPVGPSFFEATTAAAFLAFAETPADACVVEVGLGGRLDATNVIPAPVASGIAVLGIDHEAFLLAPEPGTPTEPMARIGFEKAGIARRGVPLVTLAANASAAAAVADAALMAGAPHRLQGRDWHIAPSGDGMVYRDAHGTLALPLPALHGGHQLHNAGLAVAMLRHQQAVPVDEAAMAKGLSAVRWPARLHRLAPGPLTALLPPGSVATLDGGHNPSAGAALAAHYGPGGRNLHAVIGMLSGKPADAIAGPLGYRLASLTIVPVPGHDCHLVEAFAPLARRAGIPLSAAGSVADALARLAQTGEPLEALVAGSLYLAGEVLAANGEIPD